jgi:hypothetical protein
LSVYQLPEAVASIVSHASVAYSTTPSAPRDQPFLIFGQSVGQNGIRLFGSIGMRAPRPPFPVVDLFVGLRGSQYFGPLSQ